MKDNDNYRFNFYDSSDVEGRTLPLPTHKRTPKMIKVGAVYCLDAQYADEGGRGYSLDDYDDEEIQSELGG